MTANREEVSHDAFARQSLHQELVSAGSQTCSWCGGVVKKGKLKQYSVEKDDRPGRYNPIKGLFCSKGCMEDYHS